MPSPVFTSGFTSTRVASSFSKTSQSFWMTSATSARSSSGKPASVTIFWAVSASMPVSGETGTLARASGRSSASCSISMPPSTLHSDRYDRLARSSRMEK